MQIDHPFEGLSKTFIASTGPQPCKFLLIGESGGEDEEKSGRAFTGVTGRELDKFYLPQANLRRHEARVTNLVPFHPYTNRNPTADEIKFCEPFLQKEIEKTNPDILVPMGYFATRYFLGDVDLHTVHGLPYISKTRWPGKMILPTYHPAAGLHSHDTQALIVSDFIQLKHAIMGTLPPRPEDKFPVPTYIELTSGIEVSEILTKAEPIVFMGMDTEGYPGNPWGLSFCFEEGTSYVIRFGSTSAVAALGQWIHAHPETCIILHNSLHDLSIFREMGIYIVNFVDTMVYAFCLVLEPQGLKDLAFRRCGMKMKSYEDVIGPAMRKLTAAYLLKVASGDWGSDPAVPERISDKEIKWRRPMQLHKRALKAVNDIYGKYTGIIIGPRRGGSAGLDEMGVRVGKVAAEYVKEKALPKDMTAWHVEVPIPFKQRVDDAFGTYIFDELTPPVTPDDPPDSVKRWSDMQEDLEESVERCEAALGTLPETGLDALEDQQVAVNYSARDAHATLAIHKQLVADIKANGMEELAALDMAVLPYVDLMKTAGIKVNRKHMLDYGAQLQIEMREIQEKLEKEVGHWINPSSSKQVADLIYVKLGFPVEVRTKEGAPSTNDKILEALSPLHPNIKDITFYRELHKLRNTYALKLPNWMDEFERIHVRWKTTRVPTGRFAAADPNLMAIPIRSKYGVKIRAGFIPEIGHCFVGVDLSQIEMRILAHMSQDKNLMSVFLQGKDIHTASAAFMWKVTEEEIDAEHFGVHTEKGAAEYFAKYGKAYDGPAVDPERAGGASRRSSGKNVSFGIVYCISAKGLAAQMKAKTGKDWTEEQCQSMIDMWLSEAYPGVKRYMARQRWLAKTYGYVKTLMGRRRYVPGANSTIPRIREEAFRQAVNHPIQGSASEVIKLAMRNIYREVLPRFKAYYCMPILQIHDELIFEVDKEIALELEHAVIEYMQNAMKLDVPVLATAHSSDVSWAELKG